MGAVRVDVTRGAVTESVHHVHVVAARSSGPLMSAGDAGFLTFARSAVKPMQALPLVADGAAAAFGVTSREIAIACASHSGEAFHIDAVRSLLEKAGADESDLACGAHPPMGPAAAEALLAAGEAPGRVHNNCSGKHAGMLLLARHHAWPHAGYQLPGHPVQQRMLAEIARWTGVDAAAIPTGTDGCGVPTFALPLRSLAMAFARFADAAAGGDARQIAEAMTLHAEYIGGTGRPCTALMRACRGRVIAKVGAEGVYCAADLETGMGVALKVEDGSKRAAEAALMAVLLDIGVLRAEDADAVREWLEPSLVNTRGEVVGSLRTQVTMERA